MGSGTTAQATSGNQHGAAKRTQFFSKLDGAVKACAAVGSTVYAIGLTRSDVDTVLRAGFRTVDCADNADMIIARGGEEEFEAARRFAARGTLGAARKKTVLMPVRALYCAACKTYRKADGKFARVLTDVEPTAAVFDARALDNNAAVFGELVALDLAAFDYAFGAQMRGEAADTAAVGAIAKLITELTDKLRPIVKDGARAATVLTAAGARAARIIADRPEILHCSGAAQTAEALRMLCAAEDRSTAARGELEMLLAVYVTDIYIRRVGQPAAALLFPPDNNKRIDCLCEYLGADLRRACVYVAPIYPPEKLRLCEYRRAEFRAEHSRMLAALKLRQNAAWNVFKRLYPDDGYGLKTLIDGADLPPVLALAPDVFPADTMLSLLKQTGQLEKYIV